MEAQATDSVNSGQPRAGDKAPMAERILATAERLFYQRGIRAMGVDTVAAEAGISKRSLYDYFPSKEALIAAYLTRQMRPPPAESDAPARVQVLALFDRLHNTLGSPGFRGCPFVNAVAELGDSCEPVNEIAARYKAQRRAWLRAVLAGDGIPGAEALSVQLALLFEGAIATALVQHDASVALAARDAATILLDAAAERDGVAASGSQPAAGA